jgi:hypothetical protein
MGIYLFWSAADSVVFGFTADPDGHNLPAELAPWLKNGDGQSLPAAPRNALVASNAVIRTIQRDGFYLGRGATINL